MDEIDIGIACGKCDRLSPMGARSCSDCGQNLSLWLGIGPSVMADAPAGPGKPRVPDVELDAPRTRFEPPSFDEAEITPRAEHLVGVDDGPPSSVFDQRLKPRRSPSDDQVAAVSASVTPAMPPYVGNSPGRQTPPRGEPLRAPSHAPRRSTPAPRHATPQSSSGSLGWSSLSLEEQMEQAKHFVCRSCSTPVPMGHKFCGRCGAGIPPEIVNARTQFFGQLQVPGKAKLILIRGEGVEGLSYQLNAEQHVVGRTGQLVFPDDPFVSPKHANLFYRNGKLVVRDEGSLNGVYLRVRGTVDLLPGDSFLCGEQLFRFDTAPQANEGPGPDGTYFYASPKHQSGFRVTQLLQGGGLGMTACARGASLQIGREGGDLNFPTDLYMSATHCRIEDQSGKYSLTDLNSRNGTYVRLTQERELSHGDYIFIGRKLLRVEITAA